MGLQYQYKEHLIERQARAERAMLREFEQGHFTMENPLIKVNPYELNALSAVMLFETEEETAICVRILGKTKAGDMYHAFPKAKKHILPIVGLYPEYKNQIEVYPWQHFEKKVVHEIEIGKVWKRPDNPVVHMKTTPEYMQDDVILLIPALNDLGLAVDSQGDVRLHFTEPVVWDTKRIANGNLMLGSERLIQMPYFVSGLYELSTVGKIYREVRVPRGYHHDAIILPNGDICALACNTPNGTVEDQCVILDKDTGYCKRVINFVDFLKPGCSKSGSWSDEDWFHCNAVWYDENSNSLTFSGRHINAMVNIDFDTEKINWIISDPENWSPEFQKYLLKPVGDGEFDWQYEQHANLITPLGDVMCFDNHHWGTQNPEKYLKAKDSYSRGVKYRIDTEKMTIEQIWQYGKERGAEFFSPYICNVEYYNEGHYMIHSGGIAYNSKGEPSDILGSRVRRSDPEAKIYSITVETVNDEVAMELKAASNYYRAEKLKLYAPGSNLDLGPGVIVGNLDVTPEMDVEMPCDYNGTEFPDKHEGRIIDEHDMFTFFAKFEKGQLVLLSLEKGDESHLYFISTAAGDDRGAMCTGTFLSSDAREVRKCVTKEGLNGEYELFVIVDGEKFKTDVKIKC